MAFERYFRQRADMSKPRVLIGKTGQIGLNAAGLQKFGLGKATHAALFYDRDKKKIAIQFADSAKEKGLLKLVPRGNGVVIFAKSFLRYYEVDFSRAQHYSLIFDGKQDLYVLEPES